MKKSLLLAASLWPVTAFAQAGGGGLASGAPPVAAAPGPFGEGSAVPAPPPGLLSNVDFADADLPTIIQFLKQKNDEVGGDPRQLNIILSPEVEKLRLPALSLRNVTVTDVLTIATTALEVQLEPVTSQATGENVAWIVKPNGDAADNPLAVNVPGFIPAGFGGFVPASGGTTPPAVSSPTPPGTAGQGPHGQPVAGGSAGTGDVADVVVLASSGGGLGSGAGAAGGSLMGAPRPSARVFGIAPLITSFKADPDERAKDRQEKYLRLIDNLQRLANDQGGKTEVKAYGEMDIVIIRSDDAESVKLIAEVIEALKQNATSERSSTVQNPAVVR